MAYHKWKDIKRKFFYFDFGPEKGSVRIVLKNKVDSVKSLREKLHEIDSKVNWSVFKENLVPIKKK